MDYLSPPAVTAVWLTMEGARSRLAWPGLRLALELDSWRWHLSTSARKRDARRQNLMERLGWTILRVFWEDVIHDPDYVLNEIKAARAARVRSMLNRPPLEMAG